MVDLQSRPDRRGCWRLSARIDGFYGPRQPTTPVHLVSHDGRETAYCHEPADDGRGSGLLCVHGSGGTADVWEAQLSHLGGDRSVAALDLSGHGQSDEVEAVPGPAALSAYADDFETAVEVLPGPDMCFHGNERPHRERSMALMRETGQAVTRRDLLTCHAFDVRDRLDEVDAPVLAITGEHDRLTPPQYHEYLAENVRDGRAETISDAAHLSYGRAAAGVRRGGGAVPGRPVGSW